MSDRGIAYQRLRDNKYFNESQWLHDIFLSERFVAISGEVTGTGDLISFVPKKTDTFWFLAAEISNLDGSSKEIALEIDADIIERDEIKSEDSTHATLPVWGLIGDGVKAFKIEVISGAGDTHGTLYGYLELTSTRDEIKVTRE